MILHFLYGVAFAYAVTTILLLITLGPELWHWRKYERERRLLGLAHENGESK